MADLNGGRSHCRGRAEMSSLGSIRINLFRRIGNNGGGSLWPHVTQGMNGTNYYICFTLTQQVMEMYGELHL